MKIVIEKTIKRNHELCNAVDDGERDRLRNLLTMRNVQFSQKRENETVERYAAILNQPPEARQNFIQKQSGFEATSHMKGEVTYSKLGTKHVMLVQAEIGFRGHTFDKKDGIRKLAKQLQEIDVERQRKHLIETTGNNEPDEKEINTKAYIPLNCSASVYGLH